VRNNGRKTLSERGVKTRSHGWAHHSFDPQHDGALQSYLRQAVLNRFRDEIEADLGLEEARGERAPALTTTVTLLP
jgi:hypothetical protein